MSQLIRGPVIRCVFRRGISMSISQAAHPEDPSIVKSKSTKVDHKSITVADYLNGLRINKGKEHIPTKSVIHLNEHDSIDGFQVRSLLISSSIRKLQTLLLHESETSSFDNLIKGLTRQEINILLSKLTNSQIEAMKISHGYKQALSYTEHQELVKYVHTLSTRISQLHMYIQKTRGLTTEETDNLLRMLVNANDYYRAALWIRTIQQSGLDKSVYFQNIKLQILGQTSLRKLDYNGKIIRQHKSVYKSKGPRVDWATLLAEFSEASHSIIPNLDTHKELLRGFAKNGDLQQVKNHIKEIWGIDETGSSPEYVTSLSSPIYPDEELLITIISVFAHNNNLNGALPYITNFERYYKLDLSNQFLWRVLINQVRFTHAQDKEELIKTFKSVWNLMEHKNVGFSNGLYRLKYGILRKTDPELLKNDIPLIYSQYFKQISQLNASATQRLLTQYISATIKYVYKQNIESDEIVVNLILDYSVNRDQQDLLLSRAKGIKKWVTGENDKFKELQNLYDEEEEEDSMW